jgi:hypothetical protein
MSALTMPTHRPSLRPTSQSTGPPTCHLHGPDSPYTRNTIGDYSSYAPQCCGLLGGCLLGERERTERRLISELFGLLEDLHNPSVQVLLRIRTIRDSLSPELHTPRQLADEALRRFSPVTVTITG